LSGPTGAAEMLSIAAENLSPPDAYRLLVGIVVPRPIAWITTLNEQGSINLAPFSCYTFVSSDPPMVAVSCGQREGVAKDTTRNAVRSRELVVNVVSEDLVEPMHMSSAEHPPGASEPQLLGIPLAPSLTVQPPRVAASPIALECRLDRIVELGRRKTQLVIAEVMLFRISPAVYGDGKVDFNKLRPLARLGGVNYAQLGRIVAMPHVGEAGPSARNRS
jgi:flavin reductase (DIM6/NTAB) family NADH-FMN oxidoreductase RutF